MVEPVVCEVFVCKSLNLAIHLTKGCGERMAGVAGAWRETQRKREGIVKERHCGRNADAVAV